jgi:APA family basic amino acid/polyamine antiporter
VYLREAYGPLVGFLSGWTSFWIGFPASIAALAWGLGKTVAPMFHTSGRTPMWIGLGAIAVLTAVNAVGLHAGKWTQNVLTATKLAAFGGLLLVGVFIPAGDARAPEPWFSQGDTVLGIGSALVLVSFSYSGWNAATYVSGEMRDPRRGLGRALALGTGLCIALYIAINAVYLRAMPLAALRTAKVPAPQAAAQILGGEAAVRMLSPLIAVCVLSSLQASILVGPRIYHAMSTDGLFPRVLGKLHPRTGVPLLSLLLQGIISAVELVTGGFEQAVDFSVFAIAAFSTLTVAAVVVLRIRRADLERTFPVPGYPFLPLLFVVVNAWVLWSLFRFNPRGALVGLAIVGAGAPAYVVFPWLVRVFPRLGQSDREV